MIGMIDYDFDKIRARVESDPETFVAECDASFDERIGLIADRLTAHIARSPIVLLSGPSGSGKTTSAKLIERALEARGVAVHVISMDDYYRTVDLETHPRDEAGVVDYESPDCLDVPLLTSHFAQLAEGQEILVPKFDFPNQRRHADRVAPLQLGENEIAIFEGIHAMNPMISGPIGARAQKLYVSARSNVNRFGEVFFKGTWTRLMRRMIRDNNFRGADAAYTMTLWAGVRRGEKRYISPYKGSADLMINSFLPYELSILRDYALPLLENIPDPCQRREELLSIAPRLAQFPPLPARLVAPGALVREFIGGGDIVY